MFHDPNQEERKRKTNTSLAFSFSLSIYSRILAHGVLCSHSQKFLLSTWFLLTPTEQHSKVCLNKELGWSFLSVFWGMPKMYSFTYYIFYCLKQCFFVLVTEEFIQHSCRGIVFMLPHTDTNRYSTISMFSPITLLLRLFYIYSYAITHHLSNRYFQC